MVLLNWINTTGEFILADFVQRDAIERVAESGGALDKGALITAFYGSFQFWVTFVGLAIQLFLVARIYRHVGVRGALIVHPVIVAAGYGLVALAPMIGGFVPIFTLIRLVKIAENSIDYSLMNTTRHALFLPVDRDAKYEGKTAIDSFFWRFGDLIQAGVVFVGLNWLGWGAAQFALLNLLLAMAWIALAVAIGRRVRSQGARERDQRRPGGRAADPRPPPMSRAVHSCIRWRRTHSAMRIPATCCTCRPRSTGGRPLPYWLRFDPRSRTFAGVGATDVIEELTVAVIASDVDGMQARSCFAVRRVSRTARSTVISERRPLREREQRVAALEHGLPFACVTSSSSAAASGGIIEATQTPPELRAG